MIGPVSISKPPLANDETPALADNFTLTVLIFGQLAVGSASIMAKYGLQTGHSPLSLSAWRLTIASVIIFIFNTLSPQRQLAVPVLWETKRKLICSGICLGIHFYSWFASLNYIQVGRSTLLVSTAPVWTGLYVFAIQRRNLAKSFWVGLSVALAGVWMLTFDTGSEIAPFRSVLVGDILAILGAVAIAAYLINIESIQVELNTRYIVGWTYSSAAVFLMTLNVFEIPSTGMFPITLKSWIPILALALVPQLFGHTSLNWCFKRLGSVTVAASSLLEPVIAAGLAFLLFGEILTTIQLLGSVVLLVGVALSLMGGGPVVSQSRE